MLERSLVPGSGFSPDLSSILPRRPFRTVARDNFYRDSYGELDGSSFVVGSNTWNALDGLGYVKTQSPGEMAFTASETEFDAWSNSIVPAANFFLNATIANLADADGEVAIYGRQQNSDSNDDGYQAGVYFSSPQWYLYLGGQDENEYFDLGTDIAIGTSLPSLFILSLGCWGNTISVRSNASSGIISVTDTRFSTAGYIGINPVFYSGTKFTVRNFEVLAR